MTKISEIIVEPSKIYTGSVFKLKIKAIRYATYKEIKEKSYSNIKEKFTYNNLKGD